MKIAFKLAKACGGLFLPLVANMAPGADAISCDDAPALAAICMGGNYPQASSATFSHSHVGDCRFANEGPAPAWHYTHAAGYDWVAYCSANDGCKTTRGYMDPPTSNTPTWQGCPVK